MTPPPLPSPSKSPGGLTGALMILVAALILIVAAVIFTPPSSQIPERLPTQISEPLTPENLHDALRSNPRIADKLISSEETPTETVVNIQAGDNLTADLVRLGAYKDAAQTMHVAFARGTPRVVVIIHAKFRDVYGNDTVQPWFRVTLGAEEHRKANWDTLLGDALIEFLRLKGEVQILN